MVTGCNKFRLFNVLLFVGVVNILIFRSYFNKSWGVLWTSLPGALVRHDGSATSPINTTSAVRQTFGVLRAKDPHTSRSLVTQTQGVVVSSNASHADGTVATHVQDVLRTSGRGVNGSAGQNVSSVERPHVGGRAVQAWGRVVRPRANVTVPWSRGRNSSTLCPLIPPNLVGQLKTYTQAPNWTDIVHLNPGLEPGGHYRPTQCEARHRVAVIIPYRDREEHLRVLLHNLHPMLIRQQLDYFILVVELAQPTKFNRGMLLNIGAVEAGGLWDVQCFIFHDVDLVPENDKNLYTCPDKPRHMSAAVDKFNYRLPYQGIMGGVTAFTREHLYKLNGYPNMYFGWGGEDDDISARVRTSGLKIVRYPMDIARYRMIRHQRDKNNEPNPMRFKMLKETLKRQPTDGLNSLQYQVLSVEFRPAYTWILVSVDQNLIMKGLAPGAS